MIKLLEELNVAIKNMYEQAQENFEERIGELIYCISILGGIIHDEVRWIFI